MKLSTQIRIEEDAYEKVKIIAELEHRSANAQMEYFIDKCIQKYIEENGPLPGD